MRAALDEANLKIRHLMAQLAACQREKAESLSSDFAMLWSQYADAPDSSLTADAIALKEKLIATVQDSRWFGDYEHAHNKLSKVLKIEDQRDTLLALLRELDIPDLVTLGHVTDEQAARIAAALANQPAEGEKEKA